MSIFQKLQIKLFTMSYNSLYFLGTLSALMVVIGLIDAFYIAAIAGAFGFYMVYSTIRSKVIIEEMVDKIQAVIESLKDDSDDSSSK